MPAYVASIFFFTHAIDVIFSAATDADVYALRFMLLLLRRCHYFAFR